MGNPAESLRSVLRRGVDSFAARIGLLLSGIAAGLTLVELPNYAAATLLLLGTFSFLECFLRYCAGCKIFGFLARYDLVDTSSCPNCKY